MRAPGERRAARIVDMGFRTSVCLGVDGMVMEKGEREGQWHARFPRNDRLCCNYEPHVLLANMGNIDRRPVLNLWAAVQYVTKYATKAPKGSR